MYDRIDEWVVSSLTEFEGKPLHSVAQGRSRPEQARRGERRRTPSEARPRRTSALLDRMQAALKDRASAVRTTERLTESPACLVSDEHGMSMNLERILKAAGQKVPAASRSSRSTRVIRSSSASRHETDEARFADWSHILFDQAMLAEGGAARGSGQLRQAAERADARRWPARGRRGSGRRRRR